jgi:hypothetical protein
MTTEVCAFVAVHRRLVVRGNLMTLASNLIRTYTSHGAYEQDATRLARLGYVVAKM